MIFKQEIEIEKEVKKWKGVDRSEIVWHPIIDSQKCTGCGMCVTSCGKKVF